jgi:pectinesterase
VGTAPGLLAGSLVPVQAKEPVFDAIVGESFPTLAAALGAQTRSPWRILLKAGIWKEKLVIRQPGVHLIGEDREKSVLTFDAAAGQLDGEGKPLGTPGSASLTIEAPDCILHNLTLANHFDYLDAVAHQKFPAVGANGAQALALWLGKGADRTLIDQVDITGHQDTLFADSGTSLFRACRISGSVDFIYGGGRALFEDCEIVSRFRPGLQRNHGFITAPSTDRDQPFGLVFNGCRLTREPEVPPASVVLGRPYRPRRQFADGAYGDPAAVGSAVFLQCWMDDHISADGWDEMYYANKEGGRSPLAPLEARLFEFASSGPGAFENRRRPWLNAPQAAAYSEAAILDAWHPPTRI